MHRQVWVSFMFLFMLQMPCKGNKPFLFAVTMFKTQVNLTKRTNVKVLVGSQSQEIFLAFFWQFYHQQ